MPTCGGLFDGAGLLAAGLHRAGWTHSWLCESDPWRRELLRTRFPGAVVYDDVRTVRGPFAADAYGDAYGVRDEPISVRRGSGASEPRRDREAATAAAWHGEGRAGASSGSDRERTGARSDIARRVTLIAGGFPCKGASTAGKRGGFEHAETVLWGEFRRLIGELGPRYVIIENVENILGMAARPGQPRGSLWGTVLAEMAALGFDVRWDVFPAASVGAPHLRERVFAVGVRRDGPRDAAECAAGDGDRIDSAASDADGMAGATQLACAGRPGTVDKPGSLQRTQRPTGAHSDAPNADEAGRLECGRRVPGEPKLATAECAGTDATDSASGPARRDAADTTDGLAPEPRGSHGVSVQWGDYAPAIRRWERVHGEAPAPLVERVRGLDDGGAKVQRMRARVDRSDMRTQRQRLSALGDGVHVYIAEIVGEYVMGLERQRLMSEVVALAETP